MISLCQSYAGSSQEYNTLVLQVPTKPIIYYNFYYFVDRGLHTPLQFSTRILLKTRVFGTFQAPAANVLSNKKLNPTVCQCVIES